MDCNSAGNAGDKHLCCRHLLPRQDLHSLSPGNCNTFERLQVMGLLNKRINGVMGPKKVVNVTSAGQVPVQNKES